MPKTLLLWAEAAGFFEASLDHTTRHLSHEKLTWSWGDGSVEKCFLHKHVDLSWDPSLHISQAGLHAPITPALGAENQGRWQTRLSEGL